MKTWAPIVMMFILALGLVSCANNETREQKFANLQSLAARGDASAQYKVGLMYERGYGVAPDLNKAVVWFEKAAEQGEVNAQYRLGSLYYQGQVVPQNLQLAANWYQKAAAQGSTPAQAALGNMYLRGEGVPKDSAKAAYWHKKSLKLKRTLDLSRD